MKELKDRAILFLERLFTRQERQALGFVAAVAIGGLLLSGWRAGRWMEPPGPVAEPARVPVNGASAAELATLPGIGPVTAQRILQDRRRHGRYLTLSDLKRVKGISRRTLERFRGLIRFD